MKVCILIGFVVFSLQSYAFRHDVCNSCEFKSINKALENANAHDTIFVKGEKHSCANLDVNKPIVILGSDGAILDGGGEGYILRILTDSVVVDGLKFVNSGKSYTKDFAAIYVFKARHFQITNNVIENPFFGILIEKSNHGVVQGNILTGIAAKEDDGGNGIHLWHCNHILIRENEIQGLRDGIYLEFVDESEIVDNYAHDNVRYGLHFMFSNHDSYINNTFTRNGAGVAVMFSKFIVMKENHFLQNWGTSSYGLLLKEIYDAQVLDNEFKENTTAIFIEGSTRVNYFSNHLIQNGWAIKVSGGCYANKFSKNNFMGNSFDISYNSKMNDNTFDGNYWSDYTGYDLDKDAVGDIPYRPVKLFSYIVNKTPETIILLRSLFVDIINFSEKVSPVFTPDDLLDNKPSMKPFL